ncbi:MAG TPA: hypothetical protein VF076_05600 [Acidimicrobiales bacterium]
MTDDTTREIEAVARVLKDMPEPTMAAAEPYTIARAVIAALDRDVVVIDPKALITRDGPVLSYRGRNYVPQPPADSARGEDHELPHHARADRYEDALSIAVETLSRIRNGNVSFTRHSDNVAPYVRDVAEEAMVRMRDALGGLDEVRRIRDHVRKRNANGDA